MERSCAHEDVMPCPVCGKRSGLTIRFSSPLTSRDDTIQLGCQDCEKWVTEAEYKWAFAVWNKLALQECERRGTSVPQKEFIELYYDLVEAEKKVRGAEQIVQRLNGRVDEYLQREIAPLCPFKPVLFLSGSVTKLSTESGEAQGP